MGDPIWRFAVRYATTNGQTQYASAYKTKAELIKTIREHKSIPKEKERPLTPVEPWVFDSVRDWLSTGEKIRKLTIFIREPKGTQNGNNSANINARDI